MLADNQYFSQLIADSRFYSGLTFDSRFAMEVYDDYNAVKNVADSNVRLPMTDGQPDSAFADEQDAIVAIKHGKRAALDRRSSGRRRTARAPTASGAFHFSAADHDQYGTLETSPQFDFSGSYYVRPNLIDKPEPGVTQYTPPSPPTNAYAGEKLPIGNELGAHDNAPYRGRTLYYAIAVRKLSDRHQRERRSRVRAEDTIGFLDRHESHFRQCRERKIHPSLREQPLPCISAAMSIPHPCRRRLSRCSLPAPLRRSISRGAPAPARAVTPSSDR
jgi:hypothetical protein